MTDSKNSETFDVHRSDDLKKIDKVTEKAKRMTPAYQIAAMENPRAIIAHVQFNGNNFDEWAQAMQSALRVKRKYGFVDGFMVKARDDSLEFEDWMSANSMASLWILNTIEPNVANSG